MMHAATNKWAWRGAAKEGGMVTEDVAWNTMLRNQLMKVREETGNLSYVEGCALWDWREACTVSQPKEEGLEEELTSSVSAKALNSKGNLCASQLWNRDRGRLTIICSRRSDKGGVHG